MLYVDDDIEGVLDTILLHPVDSTIPVYGLISLELNYVKLLNELHSHMLSLLFYQTL
jgi:hypothetical protein